MGDYDNLSRRGSPSTAGASDEGASPGIEPGKVTLAQVALGRGGISRKAASAGSIEGVDAGATLERAQSSGGGSPLPENVRGKMEAGFGQDFSGVRVHSDGAAGAAANDLSAHAFAAGNDVFFNQGQYDPGSHQGQHLIAHELAHVVQQQQGGAQPMQAKATGAGVSVSSPSDAHEMEADRAADTVMAGGVATGLGGAGPAIHRDAMGDLKSSASGNWFGHVDDSEVLAKAGSLSPADKATLRDSASYDELKRRIFKKMTCSNCLQFFVVIPGWDLRWKLYWLDQGNNLDELNASQWQWLLGYVTPDTMAQLRQYPTGYRKFLENAPLEMIPAWDRLQGLVDGTWHGSAVDIRNAVVNLNPAQKATLRADNAKLRVIFQKCGDANERFHTVTYLGFELKWSVYWLDQNKQLPQLSSPQWSELLAQAPRQQYDELVGWADLWASVQKYCPAGVLQVTRQNSDPNTAVAAFDDPVQVDTLFSTLGSAGFLATSCKNPSKAVIDDIYGKIQGRGKVVPTVDGLAEGAQMGAQSKLNLRMWFMTAKATDEECRKMFERRFRVATNGAGTMPHKGETHPGAGGTTVNVQITNFTKQGLTQMWSVCEALPPAAVENNPQLFDILRDSTNGPGNAYYWQNGRDSKSGDILMGYGPDSDLANQVGGSQDMIYQAGGAGAGSAPSTVRQFNATLRHEIGHAVDAQLQVSATWGRQVVAGGWETYSGYDDFVDAIIRENGGMKYGDKNSLYRKAMIDAVSQHKSFSQALLDRKETPPAIDPGGPVSVVWTIDLYSDKAGDGGPWYTHKWKTSASGRNFQDAYDRSNSLYSFLAATRTQRQVSDYQWRAPGEWFAECYQVYYSETETNATAPVGGLLRSRDPDAAQMISQLVDRGYSPQQMQGGTVAKTPGT
ncbi:MAG TPA: DUF4157 domain-containing protein [Kofleriaceae bacterium]|jgi:hypothetical protein